jgi:acyl carrier protein
LTVPDVTSPPLDPAAIHEAVVAELHSILGPGWLTNVDNPAIVAETRLEADLQLESLDLVQLAGALRERYGESVDLIGYIAGLSLDDMIALRVADVVRQVASTATPNPGSSS